MKGQVWMAFVRCCSVMLTLIVFPCGVTAQVSYEMLKNSVVKFTVIKKNGADIGAGIVVGKTDSSVFVLTACHVIAEEGGCEDTGDVTFAKDITVVFFEKKRSNFPGRVIGHHRKPFDLALVQVSALPNESLPNENDLPPFVYREVGSMKPKADKVSTIGHASGNWQTTKADELLDTSYYKEPFLFRFGDEGVDPGSSGGPVFDEQGRLLGMVIETVGGGAALAVKIERAKEYVEGPWEVKANLLRKDGEISPLRPSAVPPGMVPVPAGEFSMGCNEKVDKECEDDEKPGKTVTLAAFQIDTTEVTVAAYRRCVEAGQCTTDGVTMPYWDGKEQANWAWACNWGKAGRDDHPINCVDWSQAKAYCEWAGKRLPTEAEWEKSARGADGRKYSWGNTDFAQAGKVANIADLTARKQNSGMTWALEDYDDGYYGTAPVGSFPAGESPFHALDLIGNVWEWTADWYAADSYKNGPIWNPKGSDRGDYRSVRGGSWRAPPQYARASDRLWFVPGLRGDLVGFRCAQ